MKHSFASSIAAIALASGLLGGQAQAALPTGSLSFITPTGTVGASETIDVWLRYTLDANSAPLNFSSDPLTGFEAADLPTQGSYFDPDTNTTINADFASINRAYLNTYFLCSGTFVIGCGGGGSQYTFDFFTASEPGRPSVIFIDSFSLQPGQSYDYLFGTFTPKAGGAAPSTYTFYDSGLTLTFQGLDADGHMLQASIDLSSTCPTSDASCAFTRTVLAATVPEPSSYALMALGLLLMGGIAARRRHH